MDLSWLARWREFGAPADQTMLMVVVLCGVVLVVAGDVPFALLAFLLQRWILMQVLQPLLPQPVLVALGVVSLCVAGIAAVHHIGRSWPVTRSALPSPRRVRTWAFRMAAAGLGLLWVDVVAHHPAGSVLPGAAAYLAAALAVNGLLAIIVSDTSPQAAWGVLGVSDAARLMLARSELPLEAWGLWLVLDVVLVLSASLRGLSPESSPQKMDVS